MIMDPQSTRMRIGITHRLFLSILAATCLALLSMFLIMQWSITRGFLQYLDDMEKGRSQHLTAALQQLYKEHKGWEFLHNDPGMFFERLLGDRERHPPSKPEGGFDPGHPPGHPLPPRWPMGAPFVVLDGEGKQIFGRPLRGDEIALKPIIVDNRTVGYAGLRLPRKPFLDPHQLHFLTRQKWILIVAGFGLVLVVMGLSLPLSAYLIKPIRAMATATKRLSSGDYSVRIPVSTSDELGSLARSFNVMAGALEQNERARRQWIADISHELRTPLTVLRAEIEALLEGIRDTTPEAIRSLHGEVLRLHLLVNDLYQLALSDLGALTYNKEELDPVEVLTSAMATFRGKFLSKEIEVRVNLQKGPVLKVHGDRERLHQLFANILDNSLKYTDRGGQLVVSHSSADDMVTIAFEDSHPGVRAEEMDRLFDRLYRVENSRSRSSGGAGLGLAISKNIVEGHQGAITAKPSILGGIMIEITLPAIEERKG